MTSFPTALAILRCRLATASLPLARLPDPGWRLDSFRWARRNAFIERLNGSGAWTFR